MGAIEYHLNNQTIGARQLSRGREAAAKPLPLDSAFMFVDSSGDVKYVNKSAQGLFGLLPEAVLEKNIEHFPELFSRMQNISQPLLHALLNQKELLRNRAVFNNDGRPIDLTVGCIPLFLFNKLMGIIMIARLANEQKDKPLLFDTLEKERKRINLARESLYLVPPW